MAVPVVKGLNQALFTRVLVGALGSGLVFGYAWWFTGHRANVGPMRDFYRNQGSIGGK